MKLKSILIFFPLLLVSSALAFQSGTKAPDQNELVKKARQSYYSLKALGVNEFNCKVEPDWALMYQSVPSDDPMQTEVVPLLKQTHFAVRVSGTGGATVSKTTDAAPSSHQSSERYRVASGSMEQILTGFFQSWTVFMFNIPIPAPGEDFGFEDLGETYRLTMHDGDSTAVVIMDRDLQMKSMSAKNAKIDSTLQLKMEKSKTGLFFLSGYGVDIPVGDGNTIPMTLDVKHQDLEGVLVPEAVNVLLAIPNRPMHLNMAFKDCQYKKL